MKETLLGAIQTGVSYMLPFVVAGGILIALGFALGGYDIPNTVEPGRNFASTIFWIGKIGLSTFMVPILGGYVAFSIADKPGICVGMFGGWMATDPWGMGYGSGFLGALIAGIIAGYLVNGLKKLPLPNALRSLLPTLIIPVIGCAVICLLMHYVIGIPLGSMVTSLTNMLNTLGSGNLIILGLVHGAMIAFDMGGPLNKVSYAFAIACMEAGNYVPMSTAFAAAMTPPMAMAIAMIVKKNYFTPEDRTSIPGCIAGCLCMITEFAIPHAAKDLRRIPCFMAGSGVAGAMCYTLGITMKAPHGGLFVLFACNKPIHLILCIAVGSIVSAILVMAIGKPVEQEIAE